MIRSPDAAGNSLLAGLLANWPAKSSLRGSRSIADRSPLSTPSAPLSEIEQSVPEAVTPSSVAAIFQFLKWFIFNNKSARFFGTANALSKWDASRSTSFEANEFVPPAGMGWRRCCGFSRCSRGRGARPRRFARHPAGRRAHRQPGLEKRRSGNAPAHRPAR